MYLGIVNVIMHTDYTIVLLPMPQNRDTLPPGNPRSRIHVSLACIGIDSLCSALEWTLDVHLMSGLAICLALDIGISGHRMEGRGLKWLAFFSSAFCTPVTHPELMPWVTAGKRVSGCV